MRCHPVVVGVYIFDHNNTMYMIGHNHKRIQFNIVEMVFQFVPHHIGNGAYG